MPLNRARSWSPAANAPGPPAIFPADDSERREAGDDDYARRNFGPVLPVTTFSTLDEAIALANDSEYGLTSSLYTQNLNTAMVALRQLKFGETYINRENFEAMQGFHAGWRKSGIGGADGRHGLEEYLQTHVAYLQFSQS